MGLRTLCEARGDLRLQRQHDAAELLVLDRGARGTLARRVPAPLVPVHAQPLAPAPEPVVLRPPARVEAQPRRVAGRVAAVPGEALLLGGANLERLLRLARRRGEVRRGNVETRRLRAHALDVVRLVDENHRVPEPTALPTEELLARLRVHQVVIRHEHDVRALGHVPRQIIRTRAPGPGADRAALPEPDQVLHVHGLRLTERRVRANEPVHLDVVRARAVLHRRRARRVKRGAPQRARLLVHAHLLAGADDGHAGTVPRRLELANHLSQLRVRPRRVHDHGAAAGRSPLGDGAP